MRAKRVDANQGEIVAALRAMGWAVADTSGVGRGFPDLCASKAGETVLIEVKARTGKLRQSQVDFMRDWKGRVVVARSVDDVKEMSNV